MSFAERSKASNEIGVKLQADVDHVDPGPTNGKNTVMNTEDFPSLEATFGNKVTNSETVIQAKKPKLEAVRILTWNMQDIVAVDDARVVNHTNYIKSVLKSLLSRPEREAIAVFVFQEVMKCSLLSEVFPNNFACTESITNPAAEAQNVYMALGNVIFYRTDLFQAKNQNRLEVNDTYYDDAKNHICGKTGKTLQEYWNEACDSWRRYNTRCPNPKGLEMDLPFVPTVDLKLKTSPSLWSDNILRDFQSGFRIVAVHLFAGGIWIRDAVLSQQGVIERRKFQMRALFHLIDYWNTKDKEQQNPEPTTIYAGDYNTENVEVLKEVLQPATDYGVALWCPVSGNLCQFAEVTLKSSQKKPIFSHKKGQLDTFVVDLQSDRANFNRAMMELPRKTVHVIPQETRKKNPQNCEECSSDHHPVLLSMNW
eukprot:CAMPEP_0172699292 /NCGR_PEP_ID=MMETSP1074-20121228/30077_1 /TAXON_ID=2916 /ORGANISM="Ceratium fusus, Strain PA161109" /LENGTH=423 /DNA_ID=CAMNT_0013520471 /DNA_START=122 /DNA_END=1393 /DNA_ORIENTATION=-